MANELTETERRFFNEIINERTFDLCIETLNEIQENINKLDESVKDDIEYAYKKSILNNQQTGIEKIIVKIGRHNRFIFNPIKKKYEVVK